VVLIHYPTVRDLLIIRHGQSEWNLEHRWQGWLDSRLTPLGESQARDRATQLAGSGFAPALVHSSDLGRARRTAEIIGGELGASCRVDEGLRERGGGEWEGSTTDEVTTRWPGMLEAWRRGEIAKPPGGEDDETFFARFDAAIAGVIDLGLPTLVVTHGGVLRLIASRAGVPDAALLPNLGGYWFGFEAGALADPDPLPPLVSSTTTDTE
jgi:glucosyl-3-phosphoglycerate phosphatase